MLVSLRIEVINMSLLCRAGAKKCGVGSETKSCVLRVCVRVCELEGPRGLLCFGVCSLARFWREPTFLLSHVCVCVCVCVCGE